MGTATTTHVCKCCGTLQPATLSCRTRGGTASLCGYSEYVSASIPPRKYRRQDLGGGYKNCDTPTGNAGCVPPNISSGVIAYSGHSTYDISTCVFTNASLEASADSAPGSTCLTLTPGTPTSTPSNPFAPFTTRTNFTLTQTQTVNTWRFNAGCTLYPGFFYRQLFGEDVTATLSVEDTEADAITRLLSGGGGTWSSWTVVGDGSGGTCVNPACCLARYEQRTSSFSFVYQEAQFRVTATGLTPSTLYYTHVEIYRRTYGSGSYALYQTLVLSATTDGSGNFSVDGDVPNDIGFETYAFSASMVIPP